MTWWLTVNETWKQCAVRLRWWKINFIQVQHGWNVNNNDSDSMSVQEIICISLPPQKWYFQLLHNGYLVFSSIVFEFSVQESKLELCNFCWEVYMSEMVIANFVPFSRNIFSIHNKTNFLNGLEFKVITCVGNII